MQEKERPYHHGDLKRVIIETALDMLREERGWQFTLREVARRAGVSHAAPYKHFPDKGALLTELALLGFAQMRQELAAAIESAPQNEVRRVFFAMAEAYVRFGVANPALYRLMFSADAGKIHDLYLSEIPMATFGLLLAILERGQQQGVLRQRPVQGQAAACWAQVHGFTLLSIDGLLLPEKVGDNAFEAALTTLLEGLEG
ncbi:MULTISPECIES: TetR/AcrR family transcriptional regulator [unclassified Massilia]|uniref:TetR/AcrR family transcriptional regulator n=1 Tax=unclassified Massilia TaxID=2609279 RepID=UPI0015930E63|nr:MULTISPECIES: TetR/AcrR family transcriptional regulator [unclassified Massilia]NVD96672.1 TetR/AcrR family transcriptional regulator [Massilia sp. BJB1822]UTY57220.1 TetR/AcrR family transcriptional regulator [Massilia sp. erpn]